MFSTLNEKFEKIVSSLKGKAIITESDLDLTLREIRIALLEADVALVVVKDFIENTRAETLENGYVLTIFGRKLYFPNLQSQPAARREGVLRSAINAPLQGSAADLIKRAMVALDELLRKNKLKAELILQVHDELVLEVPRDEVDLVKKYLNDAMINAAKLQIPLLIDIGVNHHWHGAH